jgi:hypothetical protein
MAGHELRTLTAMLSPNRTKHVRIAGTNPNQKYGLNSTIFLQIKSQPHSQTQTPRDKRQTPITVDRPVGTSFDELHRHAVRHVIGRRRPIAPIDARATIFRAHLVVVVPSLPLVRREILSHKHLCAAFKRACE